MSVDVMLPLQPLGTALAVHAHGHTKPYQLFLNANRPWLQFYQEFRFLPRAVPFDDDLAPIQHLPDEIQLLVFQKLSAFYLGRLACVCKGWKRLSEHPRLWERACHEAFAHEREELPARLPLYRNSWRDMFISHPHLWFDGLYVSRNTYVRTGVVEWTRQKAVHLVAYFRYFRFFPCGALLYRTTPQTVKAIAKSMAGPKHLHMTPDGQQLPGCRAAVNDHVYLGRYRIKGNKVWVVIRYPNAHGTEIRCVLKLRSTHPGANNRLDMESIVSYERDSGYTADLTGAGAGNGGGAGGNGLGEEEEAEVVVQGGGGNANGAGNEGGQAQGLRHKRGLSPCVWVPWEAVATSVLNLSVKEMDMYIPG